MTMADQNLRVVMEANLDMDWPLSDNALLICPHCGCAIESSTENKERHKEWHRTIGY